jgi:hypothetical protein
MSGYTYPLLIGVAVLGTFVVHLYYLVGVIYRRRLQFVVKVGVSFALYMSGIAVSFLFAVGLCAAGCPRELNFSLTLFYYGLSIVSVFSLRNSYRRLINDSTPTPTN